MSCNSVYINGRLVKELAIEKFGDMSKCADACYRSRSFISGIVSSNKTSRFGLGVVASALGVSQELLQRPDPEPVPEPAAPAAEEGLMFRARLDGKTLTCQLLDEDGVVINEECWRITADTPYMIIDAVNKASYTMVKREGRKIGIRR